MTKKQTEMQKHKLLVIAYFFPPSNSAGGFRWIRFARQLKRMGWEIVVLTVSRSYEFYRNHDVSLLDSLPQDLDIRRAYSFELFSTYPPPTRGRLSRCGLPMRIAKRGLFEIRKKLHKIADALFIPDAKVGWVPFAYLKAKSLIREKNIDTVITTGMPHSCHFVGLALKKQTGIKWIADFRDPWVDCEYIADNFRSSWRQQFETRLEGSVIHMCDGLVLTTETARDLYQQKYPESADKCYVITNAIDHGQFEGITSKNFEKKSIVYCGNFFGKRSPKYFLEGLALFLKQNPETREKVEVHFAGSFGIDRETGRWNRDFITQHGLSDVVRTHGIIPHPECLSMEAGADLLLLISAPIETDKLYIPGKVFEYLATGKPVLAMVKGDGAVSRLIRESNSGWIAEVDDVKGIAEAIHSFWRDAIEPQKVKSPRPDLDDYSIDATTSRLISLVRNMSPGESRNV